MNIMPIPSTFGAVRIFNRLHSNQNIQRITSFCTNISDVKSSGKTGPNLREKNENKRIHKKFLLNTLPYPKIGKEEREFLTKGVYTEHMDVNLVHKPLNRNIPQVDPDEEPFNHVYQDVSDEGFFTKTESVTEKEPERWFWVERLLPKQRDESIYLNSSKSDYASGYTPAPTIAPNLPYFISRTRTGLFPVFKSINRDNEVTTLLRRVEGDVWQLEKDLMEYLSKRKKLSETDKIVTVNEVRGSITVGGDHVFDIVDFVKSKGF